MSLDVPPTARGGAIGAPWRLALRTSGAIDALSRAVGALAAWATLPMIGLAVAAAITAITDRHLGTSWSSAALVEGQWYLFAFVFLLGAPVTLLRGAHVRVDALFGRFGVRGRHWIDLVGGLLFVLPFCVFGFVESWDYVARSWSISEGSPDPGGLPRYPVKTLILVALGLLFLQGVAQCIKHAAALVGVPAALMDLPPSHVDRGSADRTDEELAR
ncbi:Tripartite ATP-independent periplasmic transporter, DctQ component [Planctomycetes bacterium Pla163]|uniref:Tripartite ATP-independent periplasmic transporter, DctQ component n=1 Tax=Rohdeia mirabilis TaxID=2528008 RepID=A0A518CVW9_9BACT|nr:Tripartite ATP-independent periplasmic transporter, DctQ component [Planctomycetes bacterium Pla163]